MDDGYVAEAHTDMKEKEKEKKMGGGGISVLLLCLSASLRQPIEDERHFLKVDWGGGVEVHEVEMLFFS